MFGNRGISMNWMRELTHWLLAAMLMGLMSHAHAQAAGSDTGDYILGPGDLIRVSVYQNQDLTMETRLSEQGTITFPLIGVTKIGNMTVGQAEIKIGKALKDGNFLKQPQVSILVLAYKGQTVSVLGQVAKPGRYNIEPLQNKLSHMIASAGGINLGNGSDIVVVTGTRGGKPFRKEIDFQRIFTANGAGEDIALENGDSLWIDRAPMVYIYGEVQRPGMQLLLRDMTLLQALAASGGLNARGTERGIRVHRRDTTGEVKVITPGMNDKLQSNDVIYVRESLF
jgi:polysaccharide biosynthesis/export protein